MTREIRVRVEDYPEDEHGISGSGTTELQGRFVRFSNVLDRHVFEEGLSAGVQAMLFSDCGFLVYENSLRAALAAASLMRSFIEKGVPVRMGLGKGTFYDLEYTTTTTADRSRVVSKVAILRHRRHPRSRGGTMWRQGACGSSCMTLLTKTSP